jgi:hypothetical protein
MQEIDRLFFDKYSIDPGSELFVTDGFANGGNDGLDGDICMNGLDEEDWLELD